MELSIAPLKLCNLCGIALINAFQLHLWHVQTLIVENHIRTVLIVGKKFIKFMCVGLVLKLGFKNLLQLEIFWHIWTQFLYFAITIIRGDSLFSPFII